MTEDYKQFDKSPIVDTSDVVIKGFRFRVRELALGIAAIVCLLVIIILAALLASAKGSEGPASVVPDADQQNQQQQPQQCEQSCFTPSCLKAAAHVTELINASAAKPCDNFHKFACSNFPSLHPLEPDEGELTTSWLIYNKNQERLRRLLEKKSSNNNPHNYETKMKNFFASCQDHFSKMQQQGRPFLQRVVAPSGGWWALKGDAMWTSNDYDFQSQLEKVHVDFWTDAFFTFSIITDWLDWNKATIQIDLSGIGIPYNYFIGTDYLKEQNDYKKFIRTVGNLLLRDSGLKLTEQEKKYRVDTFVSDAYFVESELAMIKQFAETTQNPHASDKRLRLSQLNTNSAGAVDWVRLFNRMFDRAPVTADTYVVVLEQDYVNKFTAWINNLDTANKTRILNNYLIWRLAHRYVQDLSWDYIHANRQVYVDMTGVAEFLGTWRYCVRKLDRDMREALGALFVQDHFSDRNKRTAREITDYVKRALKESLGSQFHWMSNQTRRTAIQKIDDSLYKLGYPDYMMNENTLNQVYATLTISKDDYFGNLLSFNGYYKSDWNKRLSNANSRTVWAYATYSFVAEYYNPWKELIVPAGLLQFPIYDHSSPRYMNFGSIGSIIGKQLIHAVDEIGNYYMLNGSHYGSWWSLNTTTSYKAVRKCIVDAYTNLTMGPFAIPGLSSDSPLTIPVSANYYAPLAIGESSGVQLAYKAYKDWIGVTGGEKAMPGHLYSNDQMFFISYAQTFCYNRDPYEALNLALRGTTISEDLRVNAALAQVKEFQDAFKCPATSKMVAPKRCSLY